jgi:hypothetical protein
MLLDTVALLPIPFCEIPIFVSENQLTNRAKILIEVPCLILADVLLTLK